MKTKLLLLIMIICSFAKAQVTFSESFESGTPSGWNLGGFSGSNSIPCHGNTSLTRIYNANPGNLSGAVTTGAYTSNGNSIDFSFDYRLKNNNNDFSPGAQIRVGYTVNNATHSLAVFTTYSTTCQTWSGVIPANTIPVGSQVRIVVEGIRQSGYFHLSLDNFVAFQNNTLPIISAVSSTPDFTSAGINYLINGNNATATSVINYGLSATTLNNQITGLSANGTTDNVGSVTLNSLTENTTYYYQIVATNASGTINSNVFSFKTKTTGPIIEYTFDNTLNNTSGTEPFASNAGISYVPNRFGIANKAMNINGTGTTANITSLPIGQSSRTISVWIRPTQVNSDNVLFTYGTGSGDYVYGGSFNPNNIYNFTYLSNLAYATQTFVNNWKHLVYTYEETSKTAKIYVDGVLRATGTYNTWNTLNTQLFYLGSLFGASSGKYFGYIDDLKIYSRTLNDSEVAALFNNVILETADFINDKKIQVYPNPVKDILNINTSVSIKSVEIFSLSGVKVKESNSSKVDLSKLPTGNYIVKITDEKGNINTQKIIKN